MKIGLFGLLLFFAAVLAWPEPAGVLVTAEAQSAAIGSARF